MTRTEQKCLVASTGFHAVLLTLVLVGPLLVGTPRRAPNMAILRVIPRQTVDALFSGGGNPNAPPVLTPAVETPPHAPAPPPPSQPQTPKREPVVLPPPERAESEPEPPKSEPKQEPAKATLTPDKPKRQVQVNTEIVKRGSQDPNAAAKAKAREKATREAAAKAAAAAAAKERQRRLDKAFAQLDRTADSIEEGLSGATAVEVPGPGGEAYANYSQVVYSMYYNAWNVPADAADSTASVQVQIVVRRDGTLLTQELVSRSGRSTLDRSVESALDRVRATGLPPFPQSSTDPKRTFFLKFTPAEKLGSG